MNPELAAAIQRALDAGVEGLNSGNALVFSNSMMEVHKKLASSKAVDISLELRFDDEIIAKVIIVSIDNTTITTHYKVIMGESEYTGSERGHFSNCVRGLAAGQLPNTFIINYNGVAETLLYETWVARMSEVDQMKSNFGISGKKRRRTCDCGDDDCDNAESEEVDVMYERADISNFINTCISKFANVIHHSMHGH